MVASVSASETGSDENSALAASKTFCSTEILAFDLSVDLPTCNLPFILQILYTKAVDIVRQKP